MKESSRNRDNNTKRTEKREKKVVRNFGENRRDPFQEFLSESKFAQNFCPPPIFVTQIFAHPMFVTQIFALSQYL